MGKIKKTAVALGGIGLFSAANVALSMNWLKISKKNVEIKNLPPHLEGLRILHISDIHNNSHKYLSLDIWKKVFKNDFDIAFITGDLTQAYFDHALPLRKGLCELARRVPVFFVDGNHERFHFKQMKEFLESCGIIVLDDKKIVLEVDVGNLEILGTRDYYYQKYNHFKPFMKLMGDEVRCGFRILLSHQPQIIDRLSYFQDILVLSGHTHGGQVRLPFLPIAYAPGQGFFPKYSCGLYKEKHNYLHVSPGIGASRIPIRFFNRPEIAILTLTDGGN